MSVIIKGMEMPSSCWDCYFQDCGSCDLTAQKVVDKCIIEGKRDDDCPLIRVPPHGDLVDRDKLREKEFVNDGDAYAVVMSRDIRNAPTIIPADEEDGI